MKISRIAAALSLLQGSISTMTNALHDSKNIVNTRLVSSSPPPTFPAVDASWEFTHGLEGWAQATQTEMNAEVFHMGGEMKIRVLFSTPAVEDENFEINNGKAESGREQAAHIDSPLMNIPVSERQTLAFRYRFDGRSTFAKIRLRGSDEPLHVDHGLVDWGNDDYDEEENELGFLNLYVPIQGDGQWHIGYAEIDDSELDTSTRKLNGTITQLRFWPGVFHENEHSVEVSQAPLVGSSFQIDWVRIVRAPIINRVTGCAGEKYFWTKDKVDPEYNVQPHRSTINEMLHHYQTEWIRRQTDHPYSLTYNCLWRGSERITIEGHNFGGVDGSEGAPAHVYIDGQPCTYVEHDLRTPQQKMTCLTPKLHENYQEDIVHYHTSTVEVRNGKLTGLSDVTMSLQYAILPPRPIRLSLSNFASR